MGVVKMRGDVSFRSWFFSSTGHLNVFEGRINSDIICIFPT